MESTRCLVLELIVIVSFRTSLYELAIIYIVLIKFHFLSVNLCIFVFFQGVILTLVVVSINYASQSKFVIFVDISHLLKVVIFMVIDIA